MANDAESSISVLGYWFYQMASNCDCGSLQLCHLLLILHLPTGLLVNLVIEAPSSCHGYWGSTVVYPVIGYRLFACLSVPFETQFCNAICCWVFFSNYKAWQCSKKLSLEFSLATVASKLLLFRSQTSLSLVTIQLSQLTCHWLLFGSQTCLSLADGAHTPKMSAQEASRKNIILAPVKDDISPALLVTIFARNQRELYYSDKRELSYGWCVNEERRRKCENIFLRSSYRMTFRQFFNLIN